MSLNHEQTSNSLLTSNVSRVTSQGRHAPKILLKKKKNEKEEEKKKGVMRVLSFVVVDSPHTPPLLPVSQIFTQPIATSLLQV